MKALLFLLLIILFLNSKKIIEDFSPGTAWGSGTSIPLLNPLRGENGIFFKLCWEASKSANTFKIKTTESRKAHEQWDNKFPSAVQKILAAPGKDAACCCPAPCFAGTIDAIATAASTGGSWVPPQTKGQFAVPAAAINVTKHQLIVGRLSMWLSEREQFLCPPKKTKRDDPNPSNYWRKVPEPKVDFNFHRKPKYILAAKIDKIKIPVPQAMILATKAQTAVITAMGATMAAVSSNMISQAAFPVIPATAALVKAAHMAWKIAEKAVELSKQKTFDLAHEALKFERSRIAACSLPGTSATSSSSFVQNIQKVPNFLAFNGPKRGKGHTTIPHK